MGLSYRALQNLIVDCLSKTNNWDKAISVDMETSLETLENPHSRILSISVAQRVGIEVTITNFILESETEESEIRLLSEFGSFCQRVKPLVLIGYSISRFDFPILMMKFRLLGKRLRHSEKDRLGYWGLKDTLEQCYVLDMMEPVRSELKKIDKSVNEFVSLENAIKHVRFKNLRFMETKSVVSNIMTNTKMGKWETLHKLWEGDRESYKKYIEGDVYDTLMLAEEIFQVSKVSTRIVRNSILVGERSNNLNKIIEKSPINSLIEYERSYALWTAEEDRQLITEFNQKIPYAEMARMHKRSRKGVGSRLAKLGLIPFRRIALNYEAPT